MSRRRGVWAVIVLLAAADTVGAAWLWQLWRERPGRVPSDLHASFASPGPAGPSTAPAPARPAR
jgi:hypothetical protein